MSWSRAVVGAFSIVGGVAGVTGWAPPAGAQLPVDGRIVYECAGDICVIDEDGTDLVNLTNSPDTQEIDPVWSPDGTRIAFASDRSDPGNLDANYEIFTMAADGTGRTQQTFTDTPLGQFVQSFAPSWNPDGSEIALEGWRVGASGNWAQILKVPSDGSGTETLLTDDTQPASKFEPDWSPDGTTILFTWDLGQQDIYVMGADGSNPVNLTADQPGSDQRNPAWSPDGTRFAFTDSRFWNIPTFNTEIFIRQADGSGEVQVTDHDAIDDSPSWSPDGTEIAFSSSRGGRFEIWSIAVPPPPAAIAGGAAALAAPFAEPPTTRVTTQGTGENPDWEGDGTTTPGPHTLTVTLGGQGTGTVRSTPAGVRCGQDCTESYDAGTVVTLQAKAAAGSTFAGWAGACTGRRTCVVTMDAAASVLARFRLAGTAS